ncbi:MAG: glycosyltransferase family 4 protein [Ruthenibacterium lactatiformans]
MFVGGFGHAPNVDAVEWFFREIWPLVREKTRDIFMHVLGSRPTEEIMRLDAPDFAVHGFVSDEELARFYRGDPNEYRAASLWRRN